VVPDSQAAQGAPAEE
jgi:hypothetical protein